MKKTVATTAAFVIVSVCMLGNLAGVSGADSGSYRKWTQWDSRWGSALLGESGGTMKEIGCAVTALAMLVVHSGTRSESTFDPGLLCNVLSEVGGFDAAGNIYWWKVNDFVEEFSYVTRDSFNENETTAAAKAQKIKSYLDSGHFVAVSVKYSGHWVAVDSVNGDTVNIIDPDSNANTNLFSSYDPDGVITLNVFKTSVASRRDTGEYTVTSETDLRTSSGKYYGSVAKIPAGEKLTVDDISGNWGHTYYNGVSGWICLDHTVSGGGNSDTGSDPSGYQPGKYTVVTQSGGLNYRSGPGTNYDSYGTVPSGTAVTVTAVENGWGKISYAGQQAWISLEFTVYNGSEQTNATTTPPSSVTDGSSVSGSPEGFQPGLYAVTVEDSLNCRSGPGTEYERYGALNNDELLAVTEIQDGWGKISYEGKDAWVSLEYAEYIAPFETVPPNEIIKGDINFDKAVNSLDVSLLKYHLCLRNLVISDEEIQAADLDGDGKITHGDFKLLKELTVR
ncbi:MAG: SH3 domain-containing protein [Oscillospiraceae bacterium]|jgi:uncharacterized protein YgiM (DUF1202 family)|nr:SH3 domain-containing protein [Oscillospiraceae bacterium]